MSTTNAYSDLIHLFIDGEATETERNTLFGALKDSPELQEEFASAMELKKAFAADIMQLQPPSYLQSQIAERAGLIVAASASVATAPVVVNSLSTSISSALSTVAPIATTAVSKGIIALAIGTSLGILSTIGVIKLTSNDSPKVITPAVSQNVSRPMVTAPSLILPNTPMIQSAPEGTYRSNRTNTTTNTHRSVAPLVPLTIAKATLNEKSNGISKEVKDNSAVNKTPEVIANNSQVKNNSQVSENANKSLDILAAITPIEARTPVFKAIGDNRSDRRPLNEEDMIDLGTTGTGRLSLRFTGIAASKLFQGSSNTTLPIWNNIGIAGKYDFASVFAGAVEIGQETFPIYLANGKGGFDNYQSMKWIGVSGTVTGIYVNWPMDIHPEVRLLGGISNVGPIAKISGGIILPVTARISFSTDVEETMLFIQSNGAYLTGNKLALTGALTFHF